MTSRSLVRLSFALALWVVAALAAFPAQASETVKTVVRGNYPLGAGGSLVLENVNGGVSIEGWDRSEVAVVATKVVKASSEARAREILAQYKVMVDAKPQRVKISVVYPKIHQGFLAWLGGRTANGRVEFKIKVPRELDLAVENVNGGIVLSGVRGDLDLMTVNGAVTAKRVSGKIEVETVNGGLDITEAFGEISASTVNGGISASFSDVSGSASFSSVNGGIDLRLPSSARATFDFETMNGRVRSDLPTSPPAGKRTLEGKLNGGGARIHASTTNGSIEVTGE